MSTPKPSWGPDKPNLFPAPHNYNPKQGGAHIRFRAPHFDSREARQAEPPLRFNLCFYHQRFGTASRNCQQPCMWQGCTPPREKTVTFCEREANPSFMGKVDIDESKLIFILKTRIRLRTNTHKISKPDPKTCIRFLIDSCCGQSVLPVTWPESDP